LQLSVKFAQLFRCVRFQILTSASMKFRVLWDVALMMEAVRTSETSVNCNMTTWRYVPEDSKLQLFRCVCVPYNCNDLHLILPT
jgi:hypothetical protein